MAATFRELHAFLTAASIEKYNAWWSQQPRDEFGRWTKGFVSGAFSPVGMGPKVQGPSGPGKKPSKGKQGPDGALKPGNVAAPFVSLAGTPTGPGGALHGKGDWQTQATWKGQKVSSTYQHEAAMRAFLAHKKNMSTPQDVQDNIQTSAAAHADANADPDNAPHSMDELARAAQNGGGAPSGAATMGEDPQQKIAAAKAVEMDDAWKAYQAGVETPDQEALLSSGPGGLPDADEMGDIPESLMSGYPPPAPGEPIVPPPGMPMPHEQAAENALAEADADPFYEVDATPIHHAKTGGTNDGGFFEINGVKGYAKFYKDPEQAQSEKLANDIYRALGANAPKGHLVSINGKKAVFNELIEDGTHGTAQMVQQHPQVHANFVADALLANHDVLGYSHDNIMFTPDGQAHRMDNGGALKFRAQGAAKANLQSDSVPELDSMRDPKRMAGQAFGGLSNDTVGAQIAAASHVLTPDTIAQVVEGAGFKGEQAAGYENLLNGRMAGAVAWAQQAVR